VKRVLVLVAVLALAGFAVWIASTSPHLASPDAADAADAPAPPSEDDARAVPVPPDAVAMEVLGITDGDTLRVRTGAGTTENVRLVGIDTPEVHPVSECFGDEAEAELLHLAPIGSTVRGAPDLEPYDRYGRTLLYLWNDDGVFLNLALVEGGFAEAIRVAPNDAWYDDLVAAEAAATRAGLGMWGAC